MNVGGNYKLTSCSYKTSLYAGKTGYIELLAVTLYNKVMAVKKFNRGQSAGKVFSKNGVSEKLGYYLSGFTDGEGSFNVSIINRNKDYKHGWKISLSFNISQKDDSMPKIFLKILGCGKIRYRKDGICYFETRKMKDLSEIIIPFFQKFPLLSAKNKVFTKFCKVAEIVIRRKHLTRKGIEKILNLRDLIVVGRKRKYSKEEILKSY